MRRAALPAAAAAAAAAAFVLTLASHGTAQVVPGQVLTTLTLFAGNHEGLWRTRDWGGTWERVQTRELEGLGAVHVIQPQGERVYLGGAGGFYVSNDFGETWKRTSDLKDVHSLAASRYFQADPTIFAGTADGLWKSSDDGRHFQPVELRGTTVTRLAWPGPALVAATSSGAVRVSEDSAATWLAPPQGLPEGRVHSLALSSFFAIDPVLFAGVGAAGVQRSADGGRTWSAAGLHGQRVHDLVWLGPLLYAATDAGFQRSDDDGRTWTRLGDGLGEAQLTALLFPLAPDSGLEIFVAGDRGIFRSPDGGLHFVPTGFKARADVLATFPPPPPSQPRGRR